MLRGEMNNRRGRLPAARKLGRRGLRRLRIEPLEAREVLSTADGIGVVFGAEGFANTAFSPTGQLAQLLWSDRDLVYRTRDAAGQFIDETVLDDVEGAYVSFGRADDQALLLFEPGGTPHVLMADTASLIDYARGPGGWQQAERIEVPSTSYERIEQLSAAVAPDGSWHCAFTLSDAWDTGRLVYANDLGGTWTFQEVTPEAATISTLFGDHRRYLSLAVDSADHAHISYVPEFADNRPEGQYYSRPYSVLAYATNASGAWTTEVVHRPSDDSGESGIGASIAIGPNDQVSIANCFIERVPTGSPAYARLFLHQRQANGTWSTETVASAPDGFVSGDGPNYTGFAPHLQYDAGGRPHIAFSDYACEHYDGYAHEYYGQLRHAVKEQGVWQLETIFRQTNPREQGFAYPTLALSSTEVFFSGIAATYAESSTTMVYVTASRPMVGLALGVEPLDVQEGDLAVLRIRRQGASNALPLTVNLACSLPGELSVPASITVAAGAAEAEVAVAGRLDGVADRAKLVRITASAAGYLPGSTIVNVLPASDAPGAFDPAGSVFYLRDHAESGNADHAFSFGVPGLGWVELVGDWDGDGVDTPGFYDAASSTFYLRNRLEGGDADWMFSFGIGGLGWKPLVGDWNGDGRDGIGLYEPATSLFFFKNAFAAGDADEAVQFGVGSLGWYPIVGDWDGLPGDGFGFYEPATSLFFLKNAHTPGDAEEAFQFGVGSLGWIPLAGDWDGTAGDGVGFYVPDTAQFFLKNAHTPGDADMAFTYGVGGIGWRPLVGCWQGLPSPALAPAAVDQVDLAAAAQSASPLSTAGIDGWGFEDRLFGRQGKRGVLGR